MWYSPFIREAERVLRASTDDVRAVPHVRTVLFPAEQSMERPALALPDQLDRVLSCEFNTDLAQELRRVAGGPRLHAACEAYEVANATLADGVVYARGLRLRLRKRSINWLRGTVARRFEHAVCTSSPYGVRFFGHFLTDDCTAALLADQLGWRGVRLPVVYPQAAAYERAFGLCPECIEDAHFARLTLLHDIGQSSFKRRRYALMRSRLRQVAGERTANRGVYLRRSLGGAPRVPANDDRLAATLQREGFVIVAIDETPTDALFRLLADAPLVIGVEGSHMLHGVFHVSDGGGLVCLQSPLRFNNVLKDYADCLGLSYGFLVAEPVDGGFRIPEGELLRTIELVERACALGHQGA